MGRHKEKKKVQHKNSLGGDTVSDRPSNDTSGRNSKLTFLTGFMHQINTAIEIRDELIVLDCRDGKEPVDVTPKLLKPQNQLLAKFNRTAQKVDVLPLPADPGFDTSQSLIRSRFGNLRVSMDDIIQGIFSNTYSKRDTDDSWASAERRNRTVAEYKKKFISVRLSITYEIPLFEQRSTTVLKESSEAAVVVEDNKIYDYLTIGKGRVRRITENDAQTFNPLIKTRSTNTNRKFTVDKGCHVSYYDMYETYRQLMITKSTFTPTTAIVQKKTVQDILQDIVLNEDFQLALMITCRALAGNIYQAGQRRFRNMPPKENVEKENLIKYSTDLLFRFRALPQPQRERKAVADMSFCCNNGDILAVGYGVYCFGTTSVPNSGYACIWNIKNPRNPERTYYFKCAVVTVQFSPYVPSLLAIGLYNGDIQIFDITYRDSPPISVTDRQVGCVEPIVSIKWLKIKDSDDPLEVEPLLGLSQDGSVRKYRINSTPYLSVFKIMTLDRLEGMPEGLPVAKDLRSLSNSVQANRHPKGVNLTIHPQQPDVYFVCTDEGCLVKCSTNYAHQYLEVLRTHDGTVKNMDFSPWSPKLFVTCGDDWFIRIWMVGIFKPLITLSNSLAAVHCVYWSRTHSTMILALNRSTFDIWDLRRDLLRPMSSTVVDSSFFSTFNISNCGKSVVIGNNRGDCLVCALNDMPMPAHFQYEDLEKAIIKAVSTDNDILNEVKSVGYFGYPKPEED